MRKSYTRSEDLSDSDESSSGDRHSIRNLNLLDFDLNYISEPENHSHRHSGCGDHYQPHDSPRVYHHSLENSRGKLVPNLSRAPRGYSGVSPTLTKSFNKLSLSKKDSQPEIRVSHQEVPGDDFLCPIRKRRDCSINDLSQLNQRSVNTHSRNTLVNTNYCQDLSGRFPFKETPSGHFKINSKQIVYETKELSVLVAHPDQTKIDIVAEKDITMSGKKDDDCKCNVIHNIMSQVSEGGINSLGSLLGNTPLRASPNVESDEYRTKRTSEILDPELSLGRLGYTFNDKIRWDQITLPEKKNLYLELYSRITNYTNADCKVYIDNEEFNCHLLVLQCYSELFDAYIAVKKVELPADKCSPASFAFIYEWMITGEPSYKGLTRENVLDIFIAAKYLKIKDLVEQCWAFIDNIDVFSEDNSFFMYMAAKEKSHEEICELMLPRIQGFFLMLVSSQDWLELPVEDVKNFLRSNYICVNCEMEIFMAAVRWLKHNWPEREKYKYDVLGCVRFGNIAPWQLVDIKRNPENPDFMELAKDPVLCKMIDDGLSFVIIKYWYGQENDDFTHWNNVLGLQEPPARNWSGSDKTYFTFREFLIYLDQYRRNQVIDKNRPRMMYEGRPYGTRQAVGDYPSESNLIGAQTSQQIIDFGGANRVSGASIKPKKVNNVTS